MSAVKIQYDLFETTEESEKKAYLRDLEATKELCHKLRKATFANKGEIYKFYHDFSERLAILEKFICIQGK